MGMHCLGHRDAEVFGIRDRQAAGFLLHNFLGYSYQSGILIVDGDPLGSEFGAVRARASPFTRFPRDAFYNPYGSWPLSRSRTTRAEASESDN